jgi:predicted hotdog family 3-hydroxylacyl-ACP dehydratase
MPPWRSGEGGEVPVCLRPIEVLLPHAPPMILLDDVVDIDKTSIAASVTIRDCSLFLEAPGVPSHIGIEYMAQACGAYAGSKALEQGAPVQIGLLLGTRRYQARVPWFRLGDRLIVSVSEIYSGAFDCRIEREAELLATAQLSVYQPEHSEPLQGGPHLE